MDCRICWGRSGEALIKTQFSPSAVTARLACVRGRTRGSPVHAKRQTGQRQFHCGKPPPAAEPRTMAVRRPNSGLTQTRQSLELGRQVAVDLEPNADLDKRRSCPGHLASFALRNGPQLTQASALAQAPTERNRRSDQKRDAIARMRQKETGPLAGPVAVCRRGGRQSPSRGEQLTASQLQSQKIRQPSAVNGVQYAAAVCANNRRRRMPAMRRPQLFLKIPVGSRKTPFPLRRDRSWCYDEIPWHSMQR